MRKRILYFFTLFIVSTGAIATTRDAQLTNTTGYNYNYMYPYMNNQMRTDLNPGVTISQSTNPMDVVVKTKQLSSSTSNRRVVPRRGTNTARAGATATTTAPTQSGPRPQMTQNQTQPQRRVIARRATNTRTNIQPARNNSRLNSEYVNRAAASTPVSSSRCMADYTECMNMYCLREDTAYNRCYCSAKLSQIDAQYQPAIEKLIMQIATIKSTPQWSDAEMNEYWMETVGNYTTGENSWTNLESALDIDWAGMESTARGQNAFAMGHQYCVQHLNNCNYMASNLRDAYRSEIARDCAIYEQSLQRIKNAAESIVGYYND